MTAHEEVFVDTLPRCDLCDDTARFDAKTSTGPWAYLCLVHYAQHGIGLGLGKGQRLLTPDEGAL